MDGTGSWVVLGLDLAWGARNPDGWWMAEWRGGRARLGSGGVAAGDAALERVVAEAEAAAGDRGGVVLAVDAPVVCVNASGSRPVDREMQRRFGRQHAGVHPASRSRCARPVGLAEKWCRERGYVAGWEVGRGGGGRVVMEVYPHAAVVRLCRLERIVKYKRGPVERRREEFARLQGLVTGLLARDLPWVEAGPGTAEALAAPWTKPAEDRLDALVCALAGLWHVHHGGRATTVVGDLASGFIVIPDPDMAPGMGVAVGDAPMDLPGRRDRD